MEKKIQSKKPLSSKFIQKIAVLDSELQWVSLDEESTKVAYTIAEYAAKKLIKRLKRSNCQSSLVGVDTYIYPIFISVVAWRIDDTILGLG